MKDASLVITDKDILTLDWSKFCSETLCSSIKTPDNTSQLISIDDNDANETEDNDDDDGGETKDEDEDEDEDEDDGNANAIEDEDKDDDERPFNICINACCIGTA